MSSKLKMKINSISLILIMVFCLFPKIARAEAIVAGESLSISIPISSASSLVGSFYYSNPEIFSSIQYDCSSLGMSGGISGTYASLSGGNDNSGYITINLVIKGDIKEEAMCTIGFYYQLTDSSGEEKDGAFSQTVVVSAVEVSPSPSPEPSITPSPVPSIVPSVAPSMEPSPSVAPSVVAPVISPSESPEITASPSPSLAPSPSLEPTLPSEVPPSPEPNDEEKAEFNIWLIIIPVALILVVAIVGFIIYSRKKKLEDNTPLVNYNMDDDDL